MTSSILGFDLSQNISYFTVPAAFVLCMLPNIYAVSLSSKNFDNSTPRSYRDNVTKDTSCDKITQQRIFRAKAASENGFETLGFYAAAVVAGNHTGMDAWTLNVLTLGYLVSRAGYNVTYARLQDNRNLSPLRTLFWSAGMFAIWTLFIKAGFKVMAN